MNSLNEFLTSGPPSRLRIVLLCLAVSAAVAVPWLLILWAVGLISL